jgi:hypothetical protein
VSGNPFAYMRMAVANTFQKKESAQLSTFAWLSKLLAWRMKAAVESDGGLVHFLWYLGIVTVLVGLYVFAARLSETVRCIVCMFGAFCAGYLAVQVIRTRAHQHLLAGMLISASILLSTYALHLGQSAFDLGHYDLTFSPFSACDTPKVCGDLPPYNTLSFSARALHSDVGPVLWATLLSFVAVIVFRFLPASVITVLGAWYLYFVHDQSANTDPRSTLLACGIVTLAIAWLIDKVSKDNDGFWINKLAMWSTALGMSYFVDHGSGIIRFTTFASSFAGMFFAIYLKRPAGTTGFVMVAYTYVDYLYFHTFLGGWTIGSRQYLAD